MAHERTLHHHRTHNRLRANTLGGNGHRPRPSAKPAIGRELAAWLARPKRNLIAGEWAAAASGQTFDVFNPADAAVIARVPDSGSEDINRAVRAARKAFDSGPWRRMTPSERGKKPGCPKA